MARLAALPLLLALACAHSPEPPPGPRPLTGRAQLYHGDASAALELRYQVTAARELEIVADLLGAGAGSVGTVEVELAAEGFTVAGEPVWTAEVPAGGRVGHTWTLAPTGEGLAKVRVSHGLAGQPRSEAASATFRVEADAIRLCATADCPAETD